MATVMAIMQMSGAPKLCLFKIVEKKDRFEELYVVAMERKRKLMLLSEVIFWKVLVLQQEHFLHRVSLRLELTISLYS